MQLATVFKLHFLETGFLLVVFSEVFIALEFILLVITLVLDTDAAALFTSIINSMQSVNDDTKLILAHMQIYVNYCLTIKPS